MLLNQRGLNACGPAVFFRIWLERDPVPAAAFACELLRDGTSSIGSLAVTPGDALLGQDYASVRTATNSANPNFMPETTDWMLLSALRDSENLLIDYLGEPGTVRDKLAGMTLPMTLVGWLTATSLFSTIDNNTNLVAGGDRDRLFATIPTGSNYIVLFINARFVNALVPAPVGPVPLLTSIAPSVPDHFVLMTGQTLRGDNPDWINVNVWTWGRTESGWQGQGPLFNDYFGLLTATI